MQARGNYQELIARKLSVVPPTGITHPIDIQPGALFEHQDVLTRWALKRGRCAIFADTGLGKTRMQLEWGQHVHLHTSEDILILAPLAVAAQTVREGQAIGVDVTHVRELDDVRPGLNICNYERVHKLDPERFGAVILDESSIIKHHDAKTFATLTEAFERTPFKLCATATPAPNDWTELGTHAEFLGICTRAEMLSEFFLHDAAETQIWRLKGHARDQFWKWVASWAALVRAPSDLGYDDSLYLLPPLMVNEHTVKSHQSAEGMLFALEAQTLSERRGARRASMDQRVTECAALVNAQREPWVVWCDLNAESQALTQSIEGAIEVTGSMPADEKERRLIAFAAGEYRVIVSKPSICGFGLNWQHAARMAFVGVTDSFEAYYQAVRRCWRFGQKRPVEIHVFASELEGAVVANLRRKERDAKIMADALSQETSSAVRAEVLGLTRETNPYQPATLIGAPSWLQSEAA